MNNKIKSYRKHFISKALFLIITFMILIGCSLNNPFLQTEEPIPPTPEVQPELPPAPILVESVSLQGKKTIERYIGGKYKCEYTVLPVDAENKAVFFTSSKPEIATVDENGLVIAIAVGETIITVTTVDGKKTDTITFIVYEKPVEYVDIERITVTPESLELTAGDEFLLTAIVLPDNATDRSKIIWTSSDESIAKVNQDGLVTAIAEGEVTIKATTVDSEIYDTVKVKVNRKLNPKITVIFPNGGEEFTFKASTTIEWKSEDIDCDYVRIDLIDTATGEEYMLVEKAENQGSCYWYLKSNAEYGIGENYKIRITTISDNDESTDVVKSDESDEVFKLSKVVPTIDLTAPTKEKNGGYFYLSNTISANIEWLSTDMETDNVSLYLIKNDGTVVECIDENIPNTGFYKWTLPDKKNEWADGSEYKIKIFRYDVELNQKDENVFSESSMQFTLEKVDNPFLKFIAPSGKKLYIGTQNDITWEGVGFTEDVKIELIPENTSVANYVIAEKTENDSCYEWTISEDIMKGGAFDLSTKYKIRITTLADDIRYLNGDRQGDLVDKMIDKDGNPITDSEGNEVVLKKPGTLVAESSIYLEAILAPNVYFLLDDSGSMRSYSPSRMEVLKKRMNNASAMLAKNFNIGVASFWNDKPDRELLKMAKGHTAEVIRASYADIDAPWTTPVASSLKRILDMRKFEIEGDIYNEYRRKAVVVITDGAPDNPLSDAVQQSALLAANGVPVFFMGISAGSLTSSLSKSLQEMAVAGGTNNPTDPDRNWYPIDQDDQFEAALNEIMYGDLEVAGRMEKYEIDCGTPDSGNSIYFYGSHLLLGNTTSPTSASGLLKATYENGKYYVKIIKQEDSSFEWGVVEANAKGTIMKIEKAPLHTSDETSPTFNGWDENTIIIKVAKSFGYNKIHYWNCSNKTSYPETIWPGVDMTVSGDDYIYTFLGTTSVELIIANGNNDKLFKGGTNGNMAASSPGIYRVDKNGIKKEN